MKRLHGIRTTVWTLSLLAGASLAVAQNAGGWRRVGDQRASNQSPANVSQDQNIPPAPVPGQLTIRPGTFVAVRLNQAVSSDRNRAGDGFSATLAQPIVVDGFVVAERGQTVGGQVVEAKKAGRVEGVSRLGIQLTDLTLADGTPVPVQSQLITRTGPTSTGADAAAITGTTALGAALGAAAGWGTGAAIGAGAGAGAGILGVLLTRGRPTVIGPETLLTFRIQSPVTVSTNRSPQSFRYVEPNDYGEPSQPPAQAQPQLRAAGPGPGYRPPPPPPYYYGAPYPYYPYPYPYYPYYWGPGFYGPSVVIGFHGGGFHHHH